MNDKQQNGGARVLEQLGFEDAGEWILTARHIECRIAKFAEERNILYAFVTDQQVLYIGKSVRSLRDRMHGYAKPGPTQRTNITNRDWIVRLLNDGSAVHVYVFAPGEQVFYRGIELNLEAGLEDWLIDQIRPPWNKMGIKRLPAPAVNVVSRNMSLTSTEGNLASAIWDRVKMLDGKTLTTLKQAKTFRVLDVSPNQIRFRPSGGKGPIRSCSRKDIEHIAELGLERDEVTVARIREEWPDNQNTSYLAAILYEAMSL